jgi:hypothetical protein
MEVIADKSGLPFLPTQPQYARAVLAGDETAERLFLDCLASDLARCPGRGPGFNSPPWHLTAGPNLGIREPQYE